MPKITTFIYIYKKKKLKLYKNNLNKPFIFFLIKILFANTI